MLLYGILAISCAISRCLSSIEPSNHWIYSDRVKFTIPTDTNRLSCICEDGAKSQLKEKLGHSTVDYTQFLKSTSNLHRYCEIKEKERECELSNCSRVVMWDMALHFCLNYKTKFMEFIPCLKEAQPTMDQVCHQNCWQSAISLMPIYGQKGRDKTRETQRRCYYQTCYVDCQEMVIKSRCKSDAPALFLEEFLANQTEILLQLDPALPKNCWSLAPKSNIVLSSWREAEVKVLDKKTEPQITWIPNSKEQVNSANKQTFIPPIVLYFFLFYLLQ